MKTIGAFFVSCLLLPVAYLLIGLDAWAGASRNILFELFFISFGILVAVLAFRLGGKKVFLIIPLAYVLFVCALPFIALSPVKPAVIAVREISPGMNEAEVRAVIDRHFPERGRFRRPEIGPLREGRISFVLDKTDGRYNAAVVQIKFIGGKCVGAEFLAD